MENGYEGTLREDDMLWKKVIDARWGCFMGEGSSETAKPHGKGLWKMIGLGLQKFKEHHKISQS